MRELLELNTALTTLDLSHNHFSETLELGAALGISATSTMPALPEVLVCSGHFAREHANAAANDYVQVVNLSWNHLRGRGALAIGSSLCVRHYTLLGLYSCLQQCFSFTRYYLLEAAPIHHSHYAQMESSRILLNLN